MKHISIPSRRGHVCRTRNIEKLVLREWCALKKVVQLEIFFIPLCMRTKCNMFFLELLPFSVQHIYFRKVGRGGGHLQVLKKIYWPCVIFKVLGPPWQIYNSSFGHLFITLFTSPQDPQIFILQKIMHRHMLQYSSAPINLAFLFTTLDL